MVNFILVAFGFLLIILLATEEFRDALQYLRRQLMAKPRLQYLVYPLAAVLGLAAAGLIALSLWSLVTGRFSYD